MRQPHEITPIERRAHRRLVFRGPATVNGHPAVCRDVSMGGVGVITGTSVDGGQPVSIRFDLPGDRRVNARAEVVRTRDGDMGLRFVKLDPSSLAALLSYVGAGVPAPVLDA